MPNSRLLWIINLVSSLLVRKVEKSATVSSDKTRQAIDTALYLEISLQGQVVALKDFLMLNRNPADMTRYQKKMSNVSSMSCKNTYKYRKKVKRQGLKER